jgi:hypothetical protein
MILMIPDQEYNPEGAFLSLTNYSMEELDTCFEELRSLGVVSKKNLSRSPRGYQLSQK